MNKRSDDAILIRVLDGLGTPDLIEAMASLPGNDLDVLLTRIARARAERLAPSDVRAAAAHHAAIFRPSEIDQRRILRFDQLFYSVVPDSYAAIELSPVSPLGLNSVLSALSQNNVASTVRQMEVTSDPTTALALEAAQRRGELLATSARSETAVRLATTQRLLRLQAFDLEAGYMQHFKCFALCSAARDVGHEHFTIEHVGEHVRAYLDFVRVMNANEFECHDVVVYLSDIRIAEALFAEGRLDRDVARRHTQDPAFDAFGVAGVDLPSTTLDLASLAPAAVERLGVGRSLTVLKILEERLTSALRHEYPEVRFEYDLARLAGIGYYDSICFHIFGSTSDGRHFQLADGGLADWTQQLLANRKERLLCSGFGADLVDRHFAVSREIPHEDL